MEAASLAVLTAVIFMTQQYASARQFTAECYKDYYCRFLCVVIHPDVKVAPPPGMTGGAAL